MKLNQIDLNKVAVFCQVFESGNFPKASEVLNVTPSALSQTISNLEHNLGVPLFLRINRKLQPTQQGQRLYQEFRHHHRALLNAVNSIASREEQVSGTLRIGAYLEFAKTQLTSVLNHFLKKYPQAQVKLSFDTPSRLHQMLKDGQVDLCFSIYPSTETNSIVSNPVYKEELVVIAPLNGPGEKADYRSLVNYPMIEYYLNHQPLRRWLQLHFQRRPPKQLPIRIYAATAEMVLSMVRSGAGLGIVPKYLLSSSEITKSVQVVRPTERKFIDHIWMLERRLEKKSVLLEEFKKMSLDHFAKNW